MMYDVIKNFNKQFEFEPAIQNSANVKKTKKYVVSGMGGSQLAAELIKTLDIKIDCILHKDYGLPELPDKELRHRLVIASSYSGNTEETVDSFQTAHTQKIPLLVISTGGKLLALAKKYRIAYIQLPATGIQPRCALGFSFKAMLKALGQTEALAKASSLATLLTPSAHEKHGRELAKNLHGRVPVIYSSARNRGLAYNWKIKLNETGKIPAFCNTIPELNHNEMNAFDVAPKTKALCNKFAFVFLQDSHDNPHIRKRMNVLKKLYKNRGLKIDTVDVNGKNRMHALFSSVILADWVSYFTAKQYGLNPDGVPMVEEFKKLIHRI